MYLIYRLSFFIDCGVFRNLLKNKSVWARGK